MKSIRLLSSVAVVLFAFAVRAANTRTWLGGEGRFSDTAKWEKGIVPASGEHWRISDGSVIEMDTDGDGSRAYFDGTIRFRGDCVARCDYDYFESVDITASEQVTLGIYASKASQNTCGSAGARYSFTVEDAATLIMGNYGTHLTNLLIRSGTCWQRGSESVSINAGGAFTLQSGSYSNAYSLTIREGTRFVQSGGELYLKKLIVDGGEIVLSGGVRTIPTAQLTDAHLVFRGSWFAVSLADTATIKSFSVEGAGGLEVAIPEGQAGGRYVIARSDYGSSLDELPVRLTGDCAGWKVLHAGNFIVVAGGWSSSFSGDYDWTGAVDDKWSTAGNWNGETVPPVANTTMVSFGHGDSNLVLTNDLVGGQYKQIRAFGSTKASSVPIVIRGETLALYGSTAKSEANSSVYTSSYYPLVFECPVTSANANGGFYTYVYNSGTSEGIVFLGGLTVGTLSMSGGPVCIGGTSTCKSISAASDKSTPNRGRLYILPDATLTITDQASAYGRQIAVRAGGRLVIQGSAFASGQTAYANTIDGTLDVEAPYAGSVNQIYSGSGRVNLGAWKDATASYAFKLSESVHLYPSYWSTTCDGELVRTVNVTAGSPTLGATCDWTYGPDVATYPGATSAAAARAAVIATNATLIVDTEDPDTQAAHTITFADPFGGPGTLAKTGVGTLVLQTAATADETSLVLSEGVLELGAAQTFRTVTFEGGSLAFSGALAAAIEGAAGQWVEVLSAGALVGAPTADGDFKLKVETDEETGAVRLFAKAATGMMILIK